MSKLNSFSSVSLFATFKVKIVILMYLLIELSEFLFLVYINDLPLFLNKNSLPILFADDTSVLVTSPNQHDFLIEINQIFAQLNSWFESNLLSLNFDKTKFVHFKMRNTPVLHTNISHKSNSIFSVNNTKFFGLIIETNLSWRTYIDKLLLKLGMVCYVLRTLKSCMSRDVLIMIYYAYFHSILTYGIIFWGNFTYTIDLFRLEKRAIKVICGIHNRVACREYFEQLKILPFQSQCLFSILMYVANNINHYKFCSQIHDIKTRHTHDLYQPTFSLSVFMNGPFNKSIKIFNKLPNEIKILIHNTKKFRNKLKAFCSFILFIQYMNISIIKMNNYTFLLILLLLICCHYWTSTTCCVLMYILCLCVCVYIYIFFFYKFFVRRLYKPFVGLMECVV
jgi:hypothetical protein